MVQENNMKKILVTGGAGFVGSHLCRRLVKENNYVICLDNYFTGNKNNIQDLVKNENFKLVNHDIKNPYYSEVDEIYNLACPASPIHYQYNAISTIKTSVLGTINMLGLAKKIKQKYYRQVQVKYTEILKFTLRMRIIGGM